MGLVIRLVELLIVIVPLVGVIFAGYQGALQDSRTPGGCTD